MFKRLVLVVSLVLPGLLGFAAVSLAAEVRTAALAPAPGKGGGPIPAGDYQFLAHRADASFTAPDGSSLTVFVTKTKNVADPRVGPSSTTTEVDAFVQVFSPAGAGGSACFILDPGAFHIGSDLRSASLQATLTSASPSCSPPGGGFPSSMTLNVQWSGAGAIATNRDTASYRCLTYGNVSTTVSMDGPSGATANVTSDALSGSLTTAQAGLHSSNQQLHAFGTVQPSCIVIV
jgi:hypothetical protein